MKQRLKYRDNAKNMRRVKYIKESDEEESAENEEQLVLRVDGGRRRQSILHERDDVRKLFQSNHRYGLSSLYLHKKRFAKNRG